MEYFSIFKITSNEKTLKNIKQKLMLYRNSVSKAQITKNNKKSIQNLLAHVGIPDFDTRGGNLICHFEKETNIEKIKNSFENPIYQYSIMFKHNCNEKQDLPIHTEAVITFFEKLIGQNQYKATYFFTTNKKEIIINMPMQSSEKKTSKTSNDELLGF